ncbi:MAG: DNA-processing protein DprA [Ruminococcus sp.]|nr:DNA-processing protein DprA [Ruminococcus sp.]
MDNIKYWLWLSMVFGSDSKTMWKVIREYESVLDAYFNLLSGETDIRLNEKQIKNIRRCSLGQAESLIDYCGKLGINLICYDSTEYPDSLRHIINPPAVLYYKGDITCILNNRTVACVGTRKPSSYTVSVTSEICRELADYGFTVISGFAVGVDITSHLAAVNINRPTACVMGCGVDVNYPAENFKFRDSIIKSGGVFISEYPPGTPAYSSNFPKRNRILSALSKATIVFEAAERSGSINTATISVEQGKELFCIPPSDINDKRYAGNISLLRSVALPLYSCDEILDFFSEERRRTDVFSETVNDNPVNKRSVLEVKKAVSVKNKPTEKLAECYIEKEDEKYKSLNSVQREIVGLLKDCTLHVDVIAHKLKIDIMDLMPELTELELNDVIKALPGKLFKIY